MKSFIKKHPIFLHKAFNGFADSLIKVFIPVIILKTTNSLPLALLFMIVKPFFFVLFNQLFKQFFIKHPVLSIALHTIFIIAVQVMIFFTKLNLIAVLIIALLMALFQAFYSVSANLLFLSTDKKLDVSRMEIGTNVGKIIFILMGGFLIGYGTLASLIVACIIATTFYLLSLIPLFSTKIILLKGPSTQDFAMPPKQKRLFDLLHLSFGSFQIVIDEVLPIYLFYTGLTFVSIAYLQALIEGLKLLSNFFANKLFLLKKSFPIIVLSGLIFIVSSFSMMFVKNTTTLFVLSALLAISFPFIFVPIFKKFCLLIQNKPYATDALSERDSQIFFGRPFVISSYYLFHCFALPFLLGILSAGVLIFTSHSLLSISEDKIEV